MSPDIFTLVILEIGSHFLPRTAGMEFLLISVFCISGMIGTYQLLVEMGVSETFLPRLVLNCNSPDLSHPSD
jgi:hypothetical protein